MYLNECWHVNMLTQANMTGWRGYAVYILNGYTDTPFIAELCGMTGREHRGGLQRGFATVIYHMNWRQNSFAHLNCTFLWKGFSRRHRVVCQNVFEFCSISMLYLELGDAMHLNVFLSLFKSLTRLQKLTEMEKW